MIRNFLTLTDSFTLFSELEGDSNLEDLDNHPLDLYLKPLRITRCIPGGIQA